jgi:hypothetical protein
MTTKKGHSSTKSVMPKKAPFHDLPKRRKNVKAKQASDVKGGGRIGPIIDTTWTVATPDHWH